MTTTEAVRGGPLRTAYVGRYVFSCPGAEKRQVRVDDGLDSGEEEQANTGDGLQLENSQSHDGA